MFGKILAALVLICAPLGVAQAGPWTVGPQPVDWTQATIGDGSTTSGGTPPYFANEPAKIASNFDTSQWISPNGTIFNNTSNTQIKFRLNCAFNHNNTADMILFPGQATGPHDHDYAGNTIVDGSTTTTSLRTVGNGSCAGGPIARVGYWEVSICKGPQALQQCLKPDLLNIYYERDKGDAPYLTRLPRGLEFVAGPPPSDPSWAARQNEYAPNLAPPYNGFVGWKCLDASGNLVQTAAKTDYSPSFVTSTGGDPWAGTCKAGFSLATILNAPSCWDGVNATSPNGRDHLRYARRRYSDNVMVCPNHWYLIPDAIFLPRWSLKKDAEYYTDSWYLSSDRMDPNPSNWSQPGTTFHADWKNGWDDNILETWEKNCLGMSINGSAPTSGAACDFNTISPNQRLISAASPDNSLPNPIVDTTQKFNFPGKLRWWPYNAGVKPMSMIKGSAPM